MALENFDGQFENLTYGEICQNNLSYFVGLLRKNDGAHELILFKADGTHEVIKDFGQEDISSFSCECSEDSYKLNYTKNGEEDSFEYSFN